MSVELPVGREVDRVAAMAPPPANQTMHAGGVGGWVVSPTSLRTETHRKHPLIGAVVAGRYQVLDQAGTGSLGTVFVCADIATTKRVALKVFRREFASDDEFMRRLRRQVKLAATLSENQPSILAVYDCDRLDGGSPFIVTEYLEGRTLKEVVRQNGPLEVSRALRLACQVAEGLDAIHSAGYVHGDVRAENVIVVSSGENESAKLKGFEVGVLRDTSPVDCLIRAGVVSSNPEYLAPEQVEGDRVTVRTDIYAFGVVLYEMLSGRVPFSASMADSVMAKHLQETPVPLGTLRREIPSVLELRVRQALEKEPERRQRYVGDVANADLSELVADEQQAILARDGRGALGRMAGTLQTRLSRRARLSGGQVSMGYPWKIGVIAAAVTLVAVFAVWLRPSPQKPQSVEVPTLQQRRGGSTAADPGLPLRSSEDRPSSPLSGVPPGDVPGAAERGMVAEQVGEDTQPGKARKAAPARKDSARPRSAGRSVESSLLLPRAREGVRRPSRPADQTAAPVTDVRRPIPDQPRAPAASSAAESAAPTRGTPDPTAIIDWLLGQPPAKE